MRLLSWAIIKKQYKRPNVAVGTVKRSIAAIASRWFRRKVSQRCAGSGCLGGSFIQREMVRSETSKPNIKNSPWIRGAPQVGFSATIRNISSRISFEILSLPADLPIFERSRQYQRNPARCNRITLSGADENERLFPRGPKRTGKAPEDSAK